MIRKGRGPQWPRRTTMKLQLSLAITSNPRTRPILDGTVKPDGIELNFFYAHSRNPARSLSKEDMGEAALGSAASSHTQTSGVLLSPVSLQVQTRRPGLRTAKRVLFIVPPWRSRQAQPYPCACVRGWANCMDHRFGRGETAANIAM